MNKIISILILILLPNISFSADKIIKIGVRAHSGIDKAMIKWQPTADHLSNSIPGFQFEIHPYININSLQDAIQHRVYDFILSNPSSYAEMEVNYGIKALATLKNKRGDQAYSQYGAVIFTRSDRADIVTLSDIKHKTFMSVAPKAFGGWRVALFEFLKNDINPYTDFAHIQYGTLQESVVYAVEKNIVDAGTVRTDMLERMAASGEIDLNNFKVINQKRVRDFSFLLSTSLYPEWPFSALEHTPEELTKAVFQALMTIEKTQPAAVAGMYDGWEQPRSYKQVHELLKSLNVSPYNTDQKINFSELIKANWVWIAGIILSIILISLFIAYLARLNKQLINAKTNLLCEIDERKQAESELTEYKAQLEHMVTKRTSELEMSNKELEAYSYSIAHDLRSPLRAITSFSQILSEDADKKLDDEEKEYLSRIINAGKLMANLIDDILNLSKVTRTQIKPSLIDLSKLSESIIADLSSQSNYRNTDWIIESNLTAKGDSRLLKMLLQNLLGNAYKFCNKDTKPRVELGTSTFEGKPIFYVKDNGIGIEENYFSKIFKPFERLVRSDEFEGTGIGLATVQRIIDRHSGKIWVESEINKGTTFYFQLDV